MRKGKRALLMLATSMATAALMILWPVQEALEVETVVVQRGELVQTETLTGMVRYAQEQPFISLKSGVISHVCVQPGQEIQKGDLLFKMDTAAEEQALSVLYEMQHTQKAALNQLDSAVSVLTLQNELEWQSYQAQLLAGIEAAHIRASGDGVMETVYVKEGDFAAEADLLGMAHGGEKQIVASALAARVSGVSLGDAAVVKDGQQHIPAKLTEMSPIDSSGMQTLSFEAGTPNGLNNLLTGESVEIEMAVGTRPTGALIPLSAVDAEGGVWVVENNKAYRRKTALGECSSTHVCAEGGWADQRVILYPEAYDLQDGMAVQVKK